MKAAMKLGNHAGLFGWMAAGMAVAGALGGLAYATAARRNGRAPAAVNEHVRQRLLEAMHGEAFAYLKYSLFAAEARRSGHSKLAALFERTARTERYEHFAEEAKLAGLVGDNEANLKDAIEGEGYETKTMYPEFATEAETAGDTQVAERFREIGRDEAKHRDAFETALRELQKQRK